MSNRRPNPSSRRTLGKATDPTSAEVEFEVEEELSPAIAELEVKVDANNAKKKREDQLKPARLCLFK